MIKLCEYLNIVKEQIKISTYDIPHMSTKQLWTFLNDKLGPWKEVVEDVDRVYKLTFYENPKEIEFDVVTNIMDYKICIDYWHFSKIIKSQLNDPIPNQIHRLKIEILKYLINAFLEEQFKKKSFKDSRWFKSFLTFVYFGTIIIGIFITIFIISIISSI